MEENIEFKNLDRETKEYIISMCRKCKFYNNRKCTKNRIIRKCAIKGLKNKD